MELGVGWVILQNTLSFLGFWVFVRRFTMCCLSGFGFFGFLSLPEGASQTQPQTRPASPSPGQQAPAQASQPQPSRPRPASLGTGGLSGYIHKILRISFNTSHSISSLLVLIINRIVYSTHAL